MTGVTNRDSSTAGAHIAVLVCVYHPEERYLREQLDSILNQTHENLSVWVSDDGDDQATRDVLTEYQAKFPVGKITLVTGPRKGFAANFLSLVSRDEIEADYYAFSDQDDIWEPKKLEQALAKLRGVAQSGPALYGSRTRLIDARGSVIGQSPLFMRKPSFRNALVQSLAGGNTMVFNHAAKELLSRAGMPDVVSHDWWAYLMITGAGGRVIYDPVSWIQYRQHGSNLIGSNVSMWARFTRVWWLFRNRFRNWNDVNIAALEDARDALSPENRKILELFVRARQSALPLRLMLLRKTGVYRQTLAGSLGLLLAAFTNKL
ncbi:glycosyltransferase family 2 protein [Guyparkeria sp. SB14A]|uniref:glycosyltransferase family 2 protein n=1 Tax=Guyparkeria sp. SB14A TaxID=2571147 RepID=UPI0010AC975C|nr:glycosyltransferase family 2 protein [Guyparkeria sp. SB14A]TKA89435.1 glycosyltransferase family 2 protein [Guyparkeria sp. SB14A]